MNRSLCSDYVILNVYNIVYNSVVARYELSVTHILHLLIEASGRLVSISNSRTANWSVLLSLPRPH